MSKEQFPGENPKQLHPPIDYSHFNQKLLEAAPWPVLIVDRNVDIMYHNERALELFDVQGPLQSQQLDNLKEGTSIIELTRQSIQDGEQYIREHTRDGLVWRITITPLEHQRVSSDQLAHLNTGSAYSHNYYYFAIAIEDQTELHRLERARRDFVTNISHELRTPLASVRLLVETLEDAIDTNRDQAQTFVAKIEDEVQHLTSMVNELLELSRLESGRIPMSMEPIKSEPLVREVMARMLPLAQRHRVTLQTDVESGETVVAADSRQISRVLVNLVHNAIKFTPSGGTIIVGTRRKEEPAMQCFFVKDTGIGIRSEDLPRVFERFYKANRARSKTDFIGPGGGGSGLGLAIARHVIEAHGGRIRAESIYQQGSTFSFTLPIISGTSSF